MDSKIAYINKKKPIEKSKEIEEKIQRNRRENLKKTQ